MPVIRPDRLPMKYGSSLYSIRMRASKKIQSPHLSESPKATKSKVQSPSSNVRRLISNEIHISGAEGLYELSEVNKIINNYFSRALSHPRGRPDKVVITIEKIGQKPKLVPLLPVSAIKNNSPEKAGDVICRVLSGAGVSQKAIDKSLRIVNAESMRGAALIIAESGIRAEPDKERGVRVSRLGIEKTAERNLAGRLSKRGINNTTVKEALVLASKVASCDGVVAELCVSDDPDYTTGYVASRDMGYVRITNIKKEGRPKGGRVFFVREDADIHCIIDYLERTPVLMKS